MTTNTSLHRQKQSLLFARQRDALLLWLLAHHPATASMLVGIGLFPTRKKAGKRMRKLVGRKQLRLLGFVTLRQGRPEHVYGRFACKANTLLHEVQITQVLLKTHAEEVKRRPGEVDGHVLPDAELIINGVRYFLELDRGTISIQEIVQQRFIKYLSRPDFVLWVCSSMERRESLRRQAQSIRNKALFTTLAEALNNPHDTIWIDYDGEKTSLPKTCDVGLKLG